MTARLTPKTVFLLTLPPLLWAGNAIVGRLLHDMLPPVLLNFLRWAIAFFLPLPLAGRCSGAKPGCGALASYAVLGLLGIGMYNALQYMALQSSTPINVTLVASGMPVWMMLTGWLFFGVPVSRRQVAGAVLSIAGVLLVLARGEWRHVLELRLVAGDLFMILATIAWSLYSWLLLRTKEPAAIRADWASLLAQVAFGAVWSGGFALGEQALGAIRCSGAGRWRRRCCTWRRARPSSPLAGGAGVREAGPSVGAFFVNLTPLFTAVLSSAFLGEAPHGYHAAAFALIVGGIVVSASRR
jgi:drug/metabolite transporter (DMT)-like permease